MFLANPVVGRIVFYSPLFSLTLLIDRSNPGYIILFCTTSPVYSLEGYTMDSPIIPFQKKKKRNHDVAILLILLAVLLGTFLFVTVAVNLLLRSIPIP